MGVGAEAESGIGTHGSTFRRAGFAMGIAAVDVKERTNERAGGTLVPRIAAVAVHASRKQCQPEPRGYDPY